MERRIVEPHEIFCASWDEIFKPFFNRMEAYERKTQSVENITEKGEENDADFLRES